MLHDDNDDGGKSKNKEDRRNSPVCLSYNNFFVLRDCELKECEKNDLLTKLV